MYLDVGELRDFYYRTRLGRSAQRRIQDSLKTINGERKGEVLLGFGFASPFLRPFRHKFVNVVNLMPESQGAMAWPPGERNVTVMCPQFNWPMKAGSVDMMLLAHALERSENPDGLLREAWRVLAPEGKVNIIIPNRLGVWASSEITPFGMGRPFSYRQMERLLSDNGFEVERMEGALFAPPSNSKLGQKTEKLLEWGLSGRSRRYFAGALIIEATKHVGVMPPKLRKSSPVFASPSLNPALQREKSK